MIKASLLLPPKKEVAYSSYCVKKIVMTKVLWLPVSHLFPGQMKIKINVKIKMIKFSYCHLLRILTSYLGRSKDAKVDLHSPTGWNEYMSVTT